MTGIPNLTGRILCGNTLQIIKEFPQESIDLAITSSPYYGPRDYSTVDRRGFNIEAQEEAWKWAEQRNHYFTRNYQHMLYEHFVRQEEKKDGTKFWHAYVKMVLIEEHIWDGRSNCSHNWEEITIKVSKKIYTLSKKCTSCKGWLGWLGREPTYDMFVKHLTDIIRALRPALKKTGSLWLNEGDGYSKNFNITHQYANKKQWHQDIPIIKGGDIPAKSLMGIPWQIAFELMGLKFFTSGDVSYSMNAVNLLEEAIGTKNWNLVSEVKAGLLDFVNSKKKRNPWLVRNVIPWIKPNNMPGPWKDRLVNRYEYVFFLTKSKNYYFDLDAIREPHAESTIERVKQFIRRGEKFDPDKHKSDPERPNQNPMSILANISKSMLGGGAIKEYVDKQSSYTGKFADFGVDSEAFGSPRARNARIPKQDSLEGPNSPLYDGFNARWKENVENGILTGGDGRTRAGLDSKSSEQKQHFKGKNPGDVWVMSTANYSGAHFSVFPLELTYRPILAACPPDGLVIDIFGGSGTTAEAVEIINILGNMPERDEVKKIRQDCGKGYRPFKTAQRRWSLIDINPGYCELAQERLKIYQDDPKQDIIRKPQYPIVLVEA